MREYRGGPRPARWLLAGVVSTVGMVFGLLGLVPGAQAARVVGGEAAITPDRGLVRRMATKGVTVRNLKPATQRRKTVRLRFRSGDFDVDTNDPAPLEPLAIEWINGQGALRGGLKFTRLARGATRTLRRSVNVTDLRVNLERRRVTGRIGRRNLLLFKINMGWATPAGESVLRPRLLTAPLRFTPAAARFINRGLGTGVLRKNLGFGQLTLAPVLAAE